jgi:hypothetical protein
MSTRTLHPAFIVTDSLKLRFFSKTVGSSTGCMIWTGAIQRNSYGAFKIVHQKIDAHVASWRIANGGQPVPLGQLVMHKCDCRMCVNPEHLQLGTASQNMLDAHKTGRGEDFKCQGEEQGNAKLTAEIVAFIRMWYGTTKTSFCRIAKKFNVSESCVRQAYHGRSWKCVTS